jgi:hypothetical protein
MLSLLDSDFKGQVAPEASDAIGDEKRMPDAALQSGPQAHFKK